MTSSLDEKDKEIANLKDTLRSAWFCSGHAIHVINTSWLRWLLPTWSLRQVYNEIYRVECETEQYASKELN